jgi:hypothetical protein
MRLFSNSILAATCLLFAAGSASAHSFSVAPVHSSYHGGNRGLSMGHGGHGGFFSRLFGFHGRRGDNVQIETVVVTPSVGALGYENYDSMPRPLAPLVVQSDEERYRNATGLALPPRHGVLLVPASSPSSDVTYIWPSNDAG